MIERPQIVRIGDLRREYVVTRHIMEGQEFGDKVLDGGGDTTEHREIVVEPYRNGEPALLSPDVLRFYEERPEGWSVRESFQGSDFSSRRPFVRDLSGTGASYDFDSHKKLVVVCGVVGQEKHIHSARYSLLALRDGEYSVLEGYENEDQNVLGWGAQDLLKLAWLKSFETLVGNGVVKIGDLPIEVIKRPGEIREYI